MQKLITIITFLIIGFTLQAQTPQGLSYQAVAFDASGNPVVNGNVGVQISVLDNSTTGTAVYTETHTKTTNAQGLFNLNIGQGTATTGTFSNIDWGTNSKYLKVELDPSGGTSYTSVGTNQLMSVPYALYSENTNQGNLSGAAGSNSSTIKNGSMIVVYTNSTAYGFTLSSSGVPTWYTRSFSGTPIGAIVQDSTIIIYTNSTAYAFTLSSSGVPTWYTRSLSGTPIGTQKSNNSAVIYTNSTAYGFTLSSSGVPTWYTRSLSGTPIGSTAVKNSIVLYTNSTAYGFTPSSSGVPTWYTRSLSGTPIDIAPK